MGCTNSAMAQKGKEGEMDGPIKPAAEQQAQQAANEAPKTAPQQSAAGEKAEEGAEDEPIDLSEHGKDLPAALVSHSKAKGLSLTKLELTSIPTELLAIHTLEVLVLQENKLTDIAPLCVLTNLRVLDIADNPIEVLSPEIGKLKKLTKLEAYKMKLLTIPEELCECTELEELNFYNNKIKKVPAGLNKLVKLKTLNLATNGIMQLPAGCLDGLTQLNRLAVFWTRLTRCASLKDLSELNLLQMYETNLIEWPEFGDSHPKLTEIALNKTPLASIPDGLFTAARFPALEIIDLSGIQLKVLNPEITNVKTLTKLSLANNQLTELPDAVCEMPNLILLSLASNKLTALPPSFGKLSDKLVSLYLDGNQIAKLPVEVGNFTKLTRCSVKGNPLDYEDATTADALGKLRNSIGDKPDGKFIE